MFNHSVKFTKKEEWWTIVVMFLMAGVFFFFLGRIWQSTMECARDCQPVVNATLLSPPPPPQQQQQASDFDDLLLLAVFLSASAAATIGLFLVAWCLCIIQSRLTDRPPLALQLE